MTEATSDITAPRISAYHRARILMSVATLISLGLFYGAARVLDVPPSPGSSVSLLQLSNGPVVLAVVLVLMVVSTYVGSLIVGQVRRDAGLMAACFGLVALTARGGTITATLHAAKSPSVYAPTLAVELVLLFAFLFLAWLCLTPLRSSHYLPPDHLRDGLEPADPHESIGNKLLASAATVIGMLILMLLLCQTQDKLQVLFAVYLAALLATAAAHSAFPVEPSYYYWLSPAVVGVVGYLYATANPGAWVIGVAANPLAAPLPLDYVAAGPPGALMGYWMSRKWQRSRETHITPADGPPMSDAHMPMG